MTFETNAVRGVVNHYGPRTIDNQYGGQGSASEGIVKEAYWDFDYNKLPNHTGAAVSIAGTNMQQVIPAGATIVSAKLVIDTAFTSTSTTTDLSIGLYYGTGTGTEIDADGLITAANATQTTIGTAGNIITGSGSLVGTTIGANAGVLVVTPVGANDLLTGAGRVVVQYVYDK
jgi:hypothetical protein